MKRAARIEETAATWLVRRESPQWSARDQAELDAWLAESTLHEVTYLRLEHGWRSVDRLAALKSPQTLQPSETIAADEPRFAGRQRMLLAAGVAFVCVMVGALVWTQLGDLRRKSYVTEVGEHSTVPLPDGSRVELNTDTQLRAAVDDQRRVVWLEHGEAYFDIAHDAARPFVVHAGERRITVLGTRFSVRREGEDVQVTVAEGRVRVDTPERSRQMRPALATRGDTVVVSEVAVLVTSRPIAKVEDALSWRQGLLVFDQVTLAQAAAEFNRYNRKQIVVDDPAAAGIPIGGRFEASNVDAFVRLISRGLKLEVDERDGVIRITS